MIKNIIRYPVKLLLVLFLLNICSIETKAQFEDDLGDDGGCENCPPDGGDDPDAPIDGGVGLLLAAGVGYGIKKAKDNKRKRINN